MLIFFDFYREREMKYIIILFTIFITISSAQNVQVVENSNLTEDIPETYYYPQFSPDDSFVYFTTGNFNELYRFDLSNRQVSQISSELSAGYKPQFTEDNGFVIYKSDEFLNRLRYSSIIMMDLFSKKKTVIVDRARNVSAPILSNSNSLTFNIGEENNLMSIDDGKLTEGLSNPSIFVYTKDSKLYVNQNGVETDISPFGEGTYVWASLSPMEDKILFTYGSQGSFIADLSGNILVELGYANYPQWSPDGNWIAAMQDYDDGYNFTDSEIILVSVDGTTSLKLTDTADKIEMYPRWSNDGKRIVYHTDDGNIHLMKLSFE